MANLLKRRIDLFAKMIFWSPFAEFLSTKRSKASRPLHYKTPFCRKLQFWGVSVCGLDRKESSSQSQHPKWISPYQRFSISILVEGFQYKNKTTHGNRNYHYHKFIIKTTSKHVMLYKNHLYIQINHGNFPDSKNAMGWNQPTKTTSFSSFSGFFFTTTGMGSQLVVDHVRLNVGHNCFGDHGLQVMAEVTWQPWIRGIEAHPGKTGAKRFGCI